MSSTNENNLTDQQLVEKVLRGDTNAFSAIIRNTEAMVAQIVFKMINNAEDRRDLAQDIYLKAFKNLSGFRFQSKLSTWIGQISYNTCLSYLEKKKLVFPDNPQGGDEVNEDALDSLSTQSSYTQNHVVENIITQKEISRILRSQINFLSPVFRILITLFHNEEMSYEEISEISGLPVGTVKSYLFRARKTLRDNILSKYKKDEL